MMSEQFYHGLIMERARHPRHAGRPERFDAQGEGDNPMCGDRIRVFFQGAGRVWHEAEGCAILLASADLMADAVAGMTAGQIRQCRAAFESVVKTGVADPSVGNLNALATVSEYRSRLRCATLPWSALIKAVDTVSAGEPA